MARGVVRADGSAPTPGERAAARKVLGRLKRLYPGIGTALVYRDSWELLVATVLSAQTTDETVNLVLPNLMAEFGTPQELAAAPPDRVEQIVYSTGYYRQKTRSLLALADAVVRRHGGRVPESMAELVQLPGVGRKTASVVLAEAFDQPAIAVDTHVRRVSKRLGLVEGSDPTRIEQDLKALFPVTAWGGLSMRLIQFGRDTCDARRPRCGSCRLLELCPYPDKNLP